MFNFLRKTIQTLTQVIKTPKTTTLSETSVELNISTIAENKTPESPVVIEPTTSESSVADTNYIELFNAALTKPKAPKAPKQIDEITQIFVDLTKEPGAPQFVKGPYAPKITNTPATPKVTTSKASKSGITNAQMIQLLKDNVANPETLATLFTTYEDAFIKCTSNIRDELKVMVLPTILTKYPNAKIEPLNPKVKFVNLHNEGI